MSRFPPKRFCIAALLLAFAAISHAQLVFACTTMAIGAKRGPCCPPGIQQPLNQTDSACERRASERSADCDAVFDLIPAQSSLADHLSASEPDCDHDTHLPMVTWSPPPITAHLIPPPVGPPVHVAATLPGERTYLATLRLRI